MSEWIVGVLVYYAVIYILAGALIGGVVVYEGRGDGVGLMDFVLILAIWPILLGVAILKGAKR